MMERVEKALEPRFGRFRGVAEKIWDYAELGFTEVRSSRELGEALREEGFAVEYGIAGMPTAFRGEWSFGIGGPVIGFLCEYDALPALSQKSLSAEREALVEGAPGHGCGHNAMGPMQGLAACALKEIAEERGMPVTLRLFGTPAEELLACKEFMVRDGVFDGVDVMFDCHSSSRFHTSYGVEFNGLMSFVVDFRGTSAHAGFAPWQGRSAADAVELMHAGTERLREHMMPEQRIHWATMPGNAAPNVVPDSCRTWYFIRSTDAGIRELCARVLRCAEGAALMTDTEHTVTMLAATHQRYPNRRLAETIHSAMLRVGLPEYTGEEQDFARRLQASMGAPQVGMASEISITDSERAPFQGQSSDTGDVTLVAPTATVEFPSWVPGARYHQWNVVACQRSSIMAKGMMAGAKAAVLAALDILEKPGLLAEIRAEFEALKAAHPYECYLPEDAVPPLGWHEADMAVFRPLLDEATGSGAGQGGC